MASTSKIPYIGKHADPYIPVIGDKVTFEGKTYRVEDSLGNPFHTWLEVVLKAPDGTLARVWAFEVQKVR